MTDDVALPGFDTDEAPAWSKTEHGYQTHLSRLSYGDGWGFWATATPDKQLSEQRGRYSTSQVDTVFLARFEARKPFALRKALIVIATGEVLASIDWEVEGRCLD